MNSIPENIKLDNSLVRQAGDKATDKTTLDLEFYVYRG